MPLTLAQLRQHPALQSATWLPAASASGFADVSNSRESRSSGQPPSKSRQVRRLAYHLYGHGPTRILWVNGHGLPVRSWKRQMLDFGVGSAETAGRYTSCFFSPRGYEDSSPVSWLYGTKQVAREIEKLLLHLGWIAAHGDRGSGMVHVVGYSFGGGVAQRLAQIRPDIFASLTLLATSSRSGEGAFSKPRFLSVFGALLARDEDARVAQVKGMAFGDGAWLDGPDDEAVEVEMGDRETMTFPTNGDRFAAATWLSASANLTWGPIMQLPAAFTHSMCEEELGDIGARIGTAKILVIHGASDPMLKEIHPKTLARGLGSKSGDGNLVRVEIIQGAGHMIHLESGRKLRELVEGHIRISERT